MESSKQFLKNIDIYGTEVILYANGEAKYKTFIGGFFSLFTFCFTIFLVIYLGMELVLRFEPKINTYFNDDRAGSVLNATNFLFAFKAKYANSTQIDLRNSNYFKLVAFLQTNDNNKIPMYKKFDFINIIECKEEFIKGFYPRDIGNATFTEIKNRILDTYLCLDFSKDIEIIGNSFQTLYSQNVLMYIEFNYLKILKDYNMTYNELFMRGIFPVNFESFHQTFTYDPADKQDPLKKEIAYVNFRNAIKTMYYINTKVSIVNSIQDNDYLFSSVTRKTLTGIKDWNTFSSVNEFLTDGLPILYVNLWMDSKREIVIRSYVKIQDVAAQISALFGIIGSFFGYFFRYYNINKMNEQLAFNIFKFRPEKSLQLSTNINVGNFKQGALKIEDSNKSITNLGNTTNISNGILKNRGNQMKMNMEKEEYDKEKDTDEEHLHFKNEIYTKPRPIGMIRPCASPLKSKSKNHSAPSFTGKSPNKASPNKNTKGLNPSPNKNLVKPIQPSIINTFEVIELPDTSNLNLNPNFIQNDPSLEASKFLQGKRNSVKLMNDKTYLIDTHIYDNNNLNNLKNYKSNEQLKILEKMDVGENKNKKEDKLSLLDKLKWCCCPNSKDELAFKEKMEFYEKATNYVVKKLDISSIIDKLEQHERLNLLTLNPYQSLIMKYAKKPNIMNVNINNIVDYYERFCNSDDDEANLEIIVNHYADLLKKNMLDSFDKRLVELLDNNVKRMIYLRSLNP